MGSDEARDAAETGTVSSSPLGDANSSPEEGEGLLPSPSGMGQTRWPRPNPPPDGFGTHAFGDRSDSAGVIGLQGLAPVGPLCACYQATPRLISQSPCNSRC